MIQAERTIITPCCGRELEIQLRMDVLPETGTTIDVECPHCQEPLAITLLSGTSNN